MGSLKSVPPADDRKILDPLVEVLSQKAAEEIKENKDLIPVYLGIFKEVGFVLTRLIQVDGAGPMPFPMHTPERKLAEAIYGLRKKYGYDGAEDGELNYSMYTFIQRVPQIKVEKGEWQAKDELRYWLYVRGTAHALFVAALHFKDSELGLAGVFIDIKDEIKVRINRAYEIIQYAEKSEDCTFAPYYSKPVKAVDEKGNLIGYIEVHMKRSEETLHKNLLDGEVVLKKFKKKKK
ncbi:hypothetical protein HYT01_00515 [Candidatus Giovannonibacteria bacterium]|nr:hypothetical protein [Candidatus Giovannonibacteria bacterium]